MKKILIFSALSLLILAGCTKTSKVVVLSTEEAKVKTVDFIEKYMVQPGTKISVKEVVDDGNMYKVVINLPGGQDDFPFFITKDGAKMYREEIDLNNFEKELADKEAQSNSSFEAMLASIPKTEKPTAELYVMSFCPYGVQAENIIMPTVDLLRDTTDIKVRYIVDLQGDDLDKVQSLHGPIEGIEDARQLCVAENYDDVKLWAYIKNINDNCYSLYSQGGDTYDACWRQAAKDAGIDAGKVQGCVNSRGADLIKIESAASSANGVSGSPTFIVNGVKYNGPRTADAFKQAICAGFENPPAECSTVLDESGAQAPAGDCN